MDTFTSHAPRWVTPVRGSAPLSTEDGAPEVAQPSEGRQGLSSSRMSSQGHTYCRKGRERSLTPQRRRKGFWNSPSC